jgi:hypothetical protein
MIKVKLQVNFVFQFLTTIISDFVLLMFRIAGAVEASLVK